MQNHPGQQIDAGYVGGEERHHVGGEEDLQRVWIHVDGHHPQQAEQPAAAEEAGCGDVSKC